MQFNEIDILEILPQRPPFVLIDTLLHVDEKLTRTSLNVSDDNMFCENGRLTEPGVIENIAQSCAARMGYISKYLCSETVKLGFIGSIRNMEIYSLPAVGETLITEIVIVEEVFQMTLVNATVSAGGKIIAVSEMKISITDIERK